MIENNNIKEKNDNTSKFMCKIFGLNQVFSHK